MKVIIINATVSMKVYLPMLKKIPKIFLGSLIKLKTVLVIPVLDILYEIRIQFFLLYFRRSIRLYKQLLTDCLVFVYLLRHIRFRIRSNRNINLFVKYKVIKLVAIRCLP